MNRRMEKMRGAGFVLRLIQAILYSVSAVVWLSVCLFGCFANRSIIDEINKNCDTVTDGNIAYNLMLEERAVRDCEESGIIDYEYYTGNPQYSNVRFTHYLRTKDVDKPYLGIRVTYIMDGTEVEESYYFELYNEVG